MFVEPPIVDAHSHIMTRRMPFRDDAWTRPTYEYSAEDFVADLDRHGIAFGVIAAASLYGDYNDYTLSALDRYRRLRATVVLDPATSLRELQQLRDRGVVGVRLQYKEGAVLPDLDGFEYGKFMNRLADCGMHVELNTNGDQLCRMLPALAERGPDIVVDHFGLLRSPEGMQSTGFQALLRAVDRGNVWVKISAGFRLEPELRRLSAAALLQAAGPERLFWGSDAPFVGKEREMRYASTLAIFHELVPDPAVRRKISDAALRFYFF